MLCGAFLYTYKATYKSTARTLSSELGHSFVFSLKELIMGKKIISLPRDAEMLETETKYLLLCMHV